MATVPLDFKPRETKGMYAEQTALAQEDNRTRYLYAAFLPARHGAIDLTTDDRYYPQYIPEGRIVMVKKAHFPDNNMSALELDDVSLPDPKRRGYSGVLRESKILNQVKSLVSMYGKRGVVQLQTPLEIREQTLPDGWTVEFAVATILDGVLNPPDAIRQQMTVDDLRKWFDGPAIDRLEESAKSPCLPTPRWYETRSDRDKIPLPTVLLAHGRALAKELRNAVEHAYRVCDAKTKAAIDEMHKSQSGKAGRAKLSSIEERTFKWLDRPTPIEQAMQFKQNQEQGILDKLVGVVKDLRGNPEPAAPTVVVEPVSDDEVNRRAEELLAKMMPNIVEGVKAKLAEEKQANVKANQFKPKENKE